MVLLTIVCLVSVLTITLRSRLVTVVARNFLSGLHGGVFGNVRSLPVQCFSARGRKSVVDRCAGSVSALERLVSRTLPSLVHTKTAILYMFYIVLCCDVPVATVIILNIIIVAFIAGGFKNNSSGCFVHRRVSLNRARNCVRRVVGKRGIVGIFYRRRRYGRNFSGVGSSLYHSDFGTRTCTGVLKPIVRGVNGVLCIVVTITNKLFVILSTPGLDVSNVTFNVSVIIPFLGVAGRFAKGMGRLSRRVGTVIVNDTNTDQVFTLVSRLPRRSRNCINLIGTRVSDDNGVARIPGRANG